MASAEKMLEQLLNIKTGKYTFLDSHTTTLPDELSKVVIDKFTQIKEKDGFKKSHAAFKKFISILVKEVIEAFISDCWNDVKNQIADVPAMKTTFKAALKSSEKISKFARFTFTGKIKSSNTSVKSKTDSTAASGQAGSKKTEKEKNNNEGQKKSTVIQKIKNTNRAVEDLIRKIPKAGKPIGFIFHHKIKLTLVFLILFKFGPKYLGPIVVRFIGSGKETAVVDISKRKPDTNVEKIGKKDLDEVESDEDGDGVEF